MVFGKKAPSRPGPSGRAPPDACKGCVQLQSHNNSLNKALNEHTTQHSNLIERQKVATLAHADAITTAKGKVDARVQRAITQYTQKTDTTIAERDATISERDTAIAELEGQLHNLQSEVKADAPPLLTEAGCNVVEL